MLHRLSGSINFMVKLNALMGARIRETREAAGLRQEDLAKVAGISKSAISQVENGKSTALTAENIFPIARLLDVEPGWLATGKGPKRSLKALVRAITDLPEADTIEVLNFVQFKWAHLETTAAQPDGTYQVTIDRLKDTLQNKPLK